MQDVAAYKWIHQLPVEDLEREKVVIESATEAGLRYGVTADSSAVFFSAQINAAKDIQQCWFSRWQEGNAPASAPDLNGEVRPELIRLGNAISSRLGQVDQDRLAFDAAVEVDCLSLEVRDALYDALASTATYQSRLQQVTSVGYLRVGTTGDYAPFSHGENTFTGIDIDLAHDLAASLGVEARFVKTSWPSLTSDLENGHFDIAMSGVSRTTRRALTGYFSTPYHVGGKTPIARCSDSARFDSLEKIDQPGVRTIVNPGGTNEKFLDANISKATKLLHQDNRTIFDEIIADRADVMFTDLIEVRLQTAKHSTLCASMNGETLTYQEKAFYMAQDMPLKQFVDTWLNQRINEGYVEAAFAKHIGR